MKLLKLNDGNFINLERCKSSKIGKSTYKYECGKSSIVIKYRSYNNHKSFVKKWYQKASFDKERNLYNYLVNINLHHLRLLKILAIEKDYFAFRYQTANLTQNKYYELQLLNSVYELNTLKLRTNKPLKNKLIQSIITNPITSIFKGAILHNIKYKRKLSLLKIACVLRNANKNNTKIKRLNFLLHRDLGNPGNIKLIEQDKIVILDFASFGIQKKWILGDLIDISFSLESIQMNLKFYNTYVNKMKLDYPDIYNNLNFNNQVRIALLRKTINFLVYSNHSYPKLYSFIDKVLLVDEKYETWYKQIFQN